ncbi:MAG: zincin-like metallopeptidase domain-containing protein [Novosphingobium sp.]|uniref:zincin-like metallopeptidase domain-containing protein n=1 Tax=Novosphingobium sp. TaxID=1874826 RepID=UPI003B99144B
MSGYVAELGAAFTCARLGIATEPRRDHAPYIATWLKALATDPRAVFAAASKAQEACDYLAGLGREGARCQTPAQI